MTERRRKRKLEKKERETNREIRARKKKIEREERRRHEERKELAQTKKLRRTR